MGRCARTSWCTMTHGCIRVPARALAPANRANERGTSPSAPWLPIPPKSARFPGTHEIRISGPAVSCGRASELYATYACSRPKWRQIFDPLFDIAFAIGDHILPLTLRLVPRSGVRFRLRSRNRCALGHDSAFSSRNVARNRGFQPRLRTSVGYPTDFRVA